MEGEMENTLIFAAGKFVANLGNHRWAGIRNDVRDLPGGRAGISKRQTLSSSHLRFEMPTQIYRKFLLVENPFLGQIVDQSPIFGLQRKPNYI